MKVDHTRPEPEGESRATKKSWLPLKVVSKAPVVVGKSADPVDPVTVAAPFTSRATS
ncbi:MAG: hypothetical protein ACYTF5_01220 [Planctomycetota bacterium]|jgi:hypothetical protein